MSGRSLQCDSRCDLFSRGASCHLARSSPPTFLLPPSSFVWKNACWKCPYDDDENIREEKHIVLLAPFQKSHGLVNFKLVFLVGCRAALLLPRFLFLLRALVFRYINISLKWNIGSLVHEKIWRSTLSLWSGDKKCHHARSRVMSNACEAKKSPKQKQDYYYHHRRLQKNIPDAEEGNT